MSLSGALIYALILSLQLAAPEMPEFNVDVIRAGRLEHELRLERRDNYTSVFTTAGDMALEIEAARRYPEIYIVYSVGDPEPRTVNMRRALVQLRSLASQPRQNIEAGADQLDIGGSPVWRIRARPELIFLGSEFFETMLLIHSSCHM